MSNVTFTMLGNEVFTWERLLPVKIVARYFWIALYTSVRRVLPGLWVGGLPTLGDAAKMQPDDVIVALDNLLEHELVEYDRKREVLRLTEFPDRTYRPDNGRAIKGLYNRFRCVPDCDIRNAHVETLKWLLDDPTRPVKDDHARAWSETFGLVTVPPPRKRGVRRLLDSDTSNPFQVSLFASPSEKVIHPPKPDTHTDTHRSKIYDLRSSSSDLGESKPRANTLALVPLPEDLPFSVPEMLEAVAAESAGRFAAGPVDERLADALCATIRACASAEVGVADLRVVGRWLAQGGLAYRTDLGPSWAAKPGELLTALGAARCWEAAGGQPIGATGRRLPARVEPAPVGAHGTGRRIL